MTPAGGLLNEIWSRGGRLTVLEGQQLLCEWIPREYEPRLTTLKDEIIRLLLARLVVKLDKKQLHKLILEIQKAGGEFRLTKPDLGPPFFECWMPDELMDEYKPLVVENADEIFEIIRPKRPATSRPRSAKCSICLKDGSDGGCRGLGDYGTRVPCPICKHDCWHHFLPERDYPKGGCNFRFPHPDPLSGTSGWHFSPAPRCDCPGWPLAAPPKPKARKKKAAAGTQQIEIKLLTEEEA